jgi:hypothetical protein
MKHCKNEKTSLLNDSDEAQKQQLLKCMFHGVLHTEKEET